MTKTCRTITLTFLKPNLQIKNKLLSAETSLWLYNFSQIHIYEKLFSNRTDGADFSWNSGWVNSGRVNPLWIEDDLSLAKSSVNTLVFWSGPLSSGVWVTPYVTATPVVSPPRAIHLGECVVGQHMSMTLKMRLHILSNSSDVQIIFQLQINQC